MSTVTPVAVAVVASDSTTVVGSVTESMVVPTVIPEPATALPTSAEVNEAEADTSDVSVLSTPSVTVRVLAAYVVAHPPVPLALRTRNPSAVVAGSTTWPGSHQSGLICPTIARQYDDGMSSQAKVPVASTTLRVTVAAVPCGARCPGQPSGPR